MSSGRGAGVASFGFGWFADATAGVGFGWLLHPIARAAAAEAQSNIDRTREVRIVAHPWICLPGQKVEILLDGNQYNTRAARDKRSLSRFDA